MEFKTPSPLSLEGNLANNFKKFKANFEIYMKAAGHETKDSATKTAILLNVLGEDAIAIFYTFDLQDNERLEYDKVFQAFEEYTIPKTNIVKERYIFNTRNQQPGESFDSFLKDLNKLIKSCDFKDQADSLLRDRIILGMKDKSLKERILQETGLSLEKTLMLCRATEFGRMQAVELHTKTTNISAVQSTSHTRFKNKPNICKGPMEKTKIEDQDDYIEQESELVSPVNNPKRNKNCDDNENTSSLKKKRKVLEVSEERETAEGLQKQENNDYALLSWLDLPEAIANLKDKVFQRMNNEDNVTRVAQSDPLIVCFGSKVFTSRQGKRRTKHVLVWMRDLAKILIAMKKRNNDIRAFENCLIPYNFDHLYDCVKELCKNDEATNMIHRPSVVLRLGTNLRNCAKILREQIEKDASLDNSQKQSRIEDLNDFWHLMKNDWKIMENHAKKILKNRSETVSQSDPADVVLAFRYIMNKYDSLIYKIKESPTPTSYNALAKHCIAHIIILNGCWSGEITRARLEHYQVKNGNEIPEEQRSRLWTNEEKEQVGGFVFFQVPGRYKRKILCFLTKKMKEAVDVLLSTRDTLNIKSGYLFARPNNGNYLGKYEFYNGTHIINEFNSVLRDQLKDAESFTAAGVRAPFDINSKLDSHFEHFRTLLRYFLSVDETAEHLVTTVSNACQSEGNIEEESDTDDDSDSCDEEYRLPQEKVSDDSDSDLPWPKTPISRVRWSDEEKEVLYKHFGKELLELKQPCRQDIKDIMEMEPALSNRTLDQVCTYINNIVTQKTKLQPSIKCQLRKRYYKT